MVKKVSPTREITNIENHPVLKLLRKPNPEKVGAEFFGEVIANKLLYGNAYILSASTRNLPMCEIYLLSPTATEIVTSNGRSFSYKYKAIGGERLYHIDPVTRMSQILHLKNYHPTNHNIGLSCLSPASLSIELHNQAAIWNNALLKNGARPSGALIVKDSNNYLTDEQFARLQEQLSDKLQAVQIPVNLYC